MRINKKTEEQVYVFHGRIPEAYLRYIKICGNLVCKKELRVLYQGYKKEESLAQLDVNILGDKPDAEDEDVTPSEATGKKSKKQVLTPLQTWDKFRRTYLTKIINAKKAMNGYLEEVFSLHEHLLDINRRTTSVLHDTL